MTRTTLCAAALPLILALALPQTAAAQTPEPLPPFEMPQADAPPPGGTDRSDPFRFPDRTPGEPVSPLDELMNNMLRRAQPHLEGLARDMGGLMDEYAPVFEELGSLMDDIGNYELPPERLPNGDIIIRRKADAPPPPPLSELPNFLPRGEGAPDRTPTDPAPPSPQPGGTLEL